MRDYTKEALNYIKTTDKFILRIIFLHLIVENQMNEILTIIFRQPEKLIKSKFSQKVNILEAKGIGDQKLIKNIRNVNNLRNIVAHSLWIAHSEIEEVLSKIETSARKDIEDINSSVEVILTECSEALEEIKETETRRYWKNHVRNHIEKILESGKTLRQDLFREVNSRGFSVSGSMFDKTLEGMSEEGFLRKVLVENKEMNRVEEYWELDK